MESSCDSNETPNDPSDHSSKPLLTEEEEHNLALAERNRNLCLARIENHTARFIRLEDLLVEQSWCEALPGELQKYYAFCLSSYVERNINYMEDSVCPPLHLIFNAFNTTPFRSVKVVILGQEEPYSADGQAMGLAFSVPNGIEIPPALANIFQELSTDHDIPVPSHGNLEKWALQGVLLLNLVLTVRKDIANSHANRGWEQFTDTVIRTISQKREGIAFVLWGKSAQEKTRLIDGVRHRILKAAHPSEGNRGFFGCKHFSQINKHLWERGIAPIDWQL